MSNKLQSVTFTLYNKGNVYYNFHPITGLLAVDILNPRMGWDLYDYVTLLPGTYQLSGTDNIDITMTMLSQSLNYNSRILSATISTEPCKEGHIWDYIKDTCSLCNLSFEDYRKGLDKKHHDEQRCMCGSEVSGFDTHVHWCPKYVKP